MGYESLHIMELQSLQVHDVIPILLPAMYWGFCRCDSQGLALWHCNVADWNIELHVT